MQECIRYRVSRIHWLQTVVIILFLIALGFTAWAVGTIGRRSCRSMLTILSESDICPSLLEDLSSVSVAICFLSLSFILWRIGRQLLPTIFFLNIASILSIGVVTLDNDVASWIFNALLAFFAPLTIHFHLNLLQLPFRSYRKLITISFYGLATLLAVPFILWIATTQENFRYSYLFRWNTRFSVFIAFLIVIVFCIVEYRNRNLLSVRGKIRLVTFGTIFAFIPMLLLSMLPELLSGTIYVPYALTFPGLLFSPLTYIYLLLRNKLIAFEELINQIVIYYMLVILLAGIYLIAISIADAYTETATALSTANISLNVILLLSFPVLYTGLHRLTNWVLYGGEINYIQIQEELSESLSLVLDQRTLKQLLLHELPARLYLEGAILFLCDETNELKLLGTKGFPILEKSTSSRLTNHLLINYLEREARPIHALTLARTLAREIHEQTEQFLFSINTISYWVPLISNHCLQGVLLLSTRHSSDFLSVNDERLLRTLAHSGGIAAYNTRLINQAAQHQQDLTKAHQQILFNREQDQQRIAHELHDNAVQQIIGISYQLTELRRQTTQDKKISSEYIENIRSELLNVSAGLRQIIGELRPAGLKELGITNALQGYLARLKRLRSDIPDIELNIDEDTIGIPEPIAICVFRVTQESIQNAIKHAHATIITLSLRIKPEKILLTVKDNGCGFNIPNPISELAQKEHYGLVSMSERVQLVRGTFSITSTCGIGTIVKVMIPIDG